MIALHLFFFFLFFVIKLFSRIFISYINNIKRLLAGKLTIVFIFLFSISQHGRMTHKWTFCDYYFTFYILLCYLIKMFKSSEILRRAVIAPRRTILLWMMTLPRTINHRIPSFIYHMLKKGQTAQQDKNIIANMSKCFIKQGMIFSAKTKKGLYVLV